MDTHSFHLYNLHYNNDNNLNRADKEKRAAPTEQEKEKTSKNL